MNCRDYDCEQNTDCPARQQKPLALVPDPIDRMKPTPAQAQRAQAGTITLITANSDGSSPHAKATHAQHRDQGMALPIVRIALLLYAVIALCIYFFWR